jgi:hypothetical protein
MKTQQYLKSDYNLHVMAEESRVPSHCRPFALSDPIQSCFAQECIHDHNEVCEDCKLLTDTIDDIRQAVEDDITNTNKDEILHQVDEARTEIYEWQAHILRGCQQEIGKQNIIDNLDDSSIFWIRDFAMKYLPQKFLETQQEWFGKKGKTIHIDCIFYIDENKKLSKVTYITIIESCVQDAYAVLCIFENVLRVILQDFPKVNKIFDRSDNAACYSTASVIAGKAKLASRRGIQLVKTEFNEPQRGKDACDRESADIRGHLKEYLNCGNDISTADQILEAITSFGGNDSKI